MRLFQNSRIDVYTIAPIMNFRGLRWYKFPGEFILHFCSKSHKYYLKHLKQQEGLVNKGLLDTGMSRWKKESVYSPTHKIKPNGWIICPPEWFFKECLNLHKMGPISHTEFIYILLEFGNHRSKLIPWTHQSWAWLLASWGGSGLANRDTWIQTESYRSFFRVCTVHGTISGIPKRLGRFFWDDRKYNSVLIYKHKQEKRELRREASHSSLLFFYNYQ